MVLDSAKIFVGAIDTFTAFAWLSAAAWLLSVTFGVASPVVALMKLPVDAVIYAPSPATNPLIV